MKIGFVTCVELGMSCIRAIYDVGGHIDFAITIPDEKARKKSGRVYLDDFCAANDVTLYKTPHINDAGCVAFLKEQQADWLFIIGWSQIAGREVLQAVRNGVIGIHPTLLPVGRGRAAIPWAILIGLKETGVTMFALDEGVDTGDIIAQLRLPIAPDETATTLYDRANAAHADLIRATWHALVAGTVQRMPQNHAAATLWPGRTPKDGEIRADMRLVEVDRLVRAVTHPYPGAFYIDEPSQRILRVWAGRPAAETAADTGPILRLADGSYEALSWEWESPAIP